MAKLFNDISKSDDRIEKYNPYHGSDGKFTSGGGSKTTVPYKGGTSGGKGSQKVKERTISCDMDDNSHAGRRLKAVAKKTAAIAVSRARKAEPKITGDLTSIVSSNGGKLVGLEYKVKEADSLTRKLVTECKEMSDDLGKDVHPNHAVKKMYDINRYTISDSEDKLAQTVVDTLGSLEKKGYKIQRVKNTLKDKDVDYRGINCVVQTKDGTYFELQFHTKKTLEVKEINHKMYEEQRKDDTPQARKEELGRKMLENANSIPTPKDIELIRPFDRIPVQKSAESVYLYYKPENSD